jgi:hypothetical protein
MMGSGLTMWTVELYAAIAHPGAVTYPEDLTPASTA